MASYKTFGNLCGNFKQTRETFSVKVPAKVPTKVPVKEIIDITHKDQLAELLKNSNVLVVKHYATWCGPCKSFAPKFEKLASETPSDVTYAQEDIDLNLTQGVNGVPTTRVYLKGNLVKEITGGDVKKVNAAIVAAKSR